MQHEPLSSDSAIGQSELWSQLIAESLTTKFGRSDRGVQMTET